MASKYAVLDPEKTRIGHTHPDAARGIPPQARLRQDPGTGTGRGDRLDRAVRRPAPPRHPAPLRLPPRDRGRARLLGGPEGPDPRLVGPPDGRPRRGPPDRVLRLRGRHPLEAVRRRRRHRLGLGHLGPRGAHPRRPQGRRRRRAEVRARWPEAQGPLHDRPHQRPPAQGRRPVGPRVRGRPGRPVAAHPQARRGRGQGLGRRGLTRRASRPAGPTTTSRPTATPSGTARHRPPTPRST